MYLDVMPLWVLFLGTIVIVVVSLELGYLLGNISRKVVGEKDSPIAVISGSVLGLGAFILAFTFGIVSNRFDSRKGLVLEEANEIRTVWLRSDFLPESDRFESKRLLRQYLDARLAFTEERNVDQERVAAFLADADSAHRRLWEIAASNARKDLNSDVAALYIESLNTLFTVHASRVTIGLQLRIPGGVLVLLLVITGLGMMSLGYQTGVSGSRRSFAQPILAVSFALVITMIAELDRPYGKFIHVSQQPLTNVQTWMSSSESSSGGN